MKTTVLDVSVREIRILRLEINEEEIWIELHKEKRKLEAGEYSGSIV